MNLLKFGLLAAFVYLVIIFFTYDYRLLIFIVGAVAFGFFVWFLVGFFRFLVKPDE